jgi:hypothetical protein
MTLHTFQYHGHQQCQSDLPSKCLVGSGGPGDPLANPERTFATFRGLALDGVPPEVFFALAFDGRMPQGSVAFHAGFMADA